MEELDLSSLRKDRTRTDRISLLPDCLLHEILSFLDSKSVVQTCLLSKRWKNLWTEIPTLNFDFSSCPKGFSVKRFICRFLSQHQSRFIKILSFSSSIHTDEAPLIVDLLLCYARYNTVQQLHLNTFDTVYPEWPLGLSICDILTVFKMKLSVEEYRTLRPPSSLKVLEIEYVDLTSREPFLREDDIMFTDVPNLESLVVVNFFYESLDVYAPKLENFELFSSSFDWEFTSPLVEFRTPSLKSVKFTNTLPTVKPASEFSCLHQVYIALDDSNFGEDDDLKVSISHLLQVFHNATSFTLPFKAVEMLFTDPSSLNGVSFHNLRYLKLKTNDTTRMANLSIGTLMNLFNCPNLEKLEVDLN